MSTSTADTPALPPGPLRVGGYTLLDHLGEGGMGVVHLARREADGHRVALKVLRPHVVGDREARERLAREVSSLSLVDSARVAQVLDADPWGEVPFVVTRYVPGPSLQERVAQSGPLAGPDLEWTALCLAEALADVHAAGVLHRDVKPTNVLMEGRSPVLIDFGLARVADDPRLTHTGWLLGTPGYLAPEILHGGEATTASDVHSWAATVAFAGLGRPPFGRGPAVAVMDRVRRGEHDLAGLPGPLGEVLRDALASDSSARPTLEQLLGWLRARAGGVTAATDPTPLPPPLQKVGALPDRVPLAATRPMPVVAAEPTADGADGAPWEAWDWDQPASARPPLAARLRAGTVQAVLPLVGGAGVAAYPWLALTVLAVLVVLVRAGSRGASSRRARRDARGPRWWDAPVVLLAAPWHLVASLPGTVLLLLWAGGVGVAGALLAYGLGRDVPALLAATGLAVTVGLWLGPGSARVRGPVAAAASAVARRPARWLVALLLLGATAAVLAAAALGQGPDWAPLAGGPVTWLRDAASGLPSPRWP